MDKSADLPCPECQTPGAERLISKLRLDYTNMAVPLSGNGDSMTTAIDHWAKNRAEKVKIEERNLRNHGTVD